MKTRWIVDFHRILSDRTNNLYNWIVSEDADATVRKNYLMWYTLLWFMFIWSDVTVIATKEESAYYTKTFSLCVRILESITARPPGLICEARPLRFQFHTDSNVYRVSVMYGVSIMYRVGAVYRVGDW